MFRLVCTCGACPEQYNVFDGEDYVGYMRLRHGYFYAEYLGKTVYEANPRGDGIFDDETERVFHLNSACEAIKTAIKSQRNQNRLRRRPDEDNLYTIGPPRPSSEW